MLQKTPVTITFGQGLDTKTDDKQLQIGKFLSLNNSVFDKVGRLTKRNGYATLTPLPTGANATTLTTLNGNLVATGSNLYAYNSNSASYENTGTIQPAQLKTLPLVRNSTTQNNPSTAVASNGLCCLVYMDNSVAYYSLIDSVTGYQVVGRTALGAGGSAPQVTIFGQRFIITYLTSGAINYRAIPISIPATFTTGVITSTQNTTFLGYDILAIGNFLYVSYTNATTHIVISATSLALVTGSPTIVATDTASLVSLTNDTTYIYVAYYNGTVVNFASLTYSLVPIVAVTTVLTATVNQITISLGDGNIALLAEVANNYGFTPASGSTVATDFITLVLVSTAGAVLLTTNVLRGVGLASKAFIGSNNNTYALVAFNEANQRTYFLMDIFGNVYMRLAATNGGGYTVGQSLPQVSNNNGLFSIPYLYADFLATVNTGQNGSTAQSQPINAIYTDLGVNLASFTLNDSQQYSSETAGALHLTGGQLWEYDNVKPVEHGFQLFPSPNTATTVPNAAITTVTTGGSITTQDYFYQFCYEWTDNQGNLHRSAPSVALHLPFSSLSGSTNTNTIYVPTLRITYKVAPNPVRIVGYRWSTGQPVYYQFTSLSSPTLNDPTVDYVTFVDTQADDHILGSTILYTTGGVVENIAAPPSTASTLYNQRLFLIDAEDQNLLWYSKQVIEATPVEMSDLFTLFVAPTIGAQGSTGVMTALAAMDDKLIIFKANAIYYMTGLGPDNTGANNDFSSPVFISSTVGCANPASIIIMPNGLMFQSDKGIWLLGHDLSTSYIGAPVEQYNSNTVMAAQNIPGTNQVRFVLDNQVTLMYDYFVGQWGTHSNVFARSATLFQGEHTYLNSFGAVYQEAPNTYTDGGVPVLMSFTTGWIALAGLQGYERFYFAYLLGTYVTPFTLNMQLAYDYNASNKQNIIVKPDNFAPAWGNTSVWGSNGSWGGPGNTFEARLFPQNQKCSTFQLTMNEVYDNIKGVSAGQGLTLSGLTLVVGAKRGFRTQKASRSFG